jgi:hypothetical protein
MAIAIDAETDGVVRSAAIALVNVRPPFGFRDRAGAGVRTW